VTVFKVAADVLAEAMARRYMIALFGAITLFLVFLVFALNLEVVDGALAASRLFGQQLEGAAIKPVDVAMRSVFQALTFFVFYAGLLFGIVAVADIAPKMLAPGRVELLLSLPVRRTELVVGTYLGVVTICLLATSFAVGGVSAVLFFKAGFFSLAPLYGALAAVLAFMAIYAVMLLATSVVRSAALAAGGGLLFYVAALLTSDRQVFLGWFEQGFTRELLSVVIRVLPRIDTLADTASLAALGEPMQAATAGPAVLGTLVFATAVVAVASFVVAGKDY
jgi:ABC-type transport system involved in multi-copper enzyme maturation permease subunit